MRFAQKHTFLKLFLSLTLVATTLLGVVTTRLAHADAAGGVYSYVLSGSTLEITCQGEFGQPDHECPDITQGTQFQPVNSTYTYVKGSKYQFKSSAGGTITISDPNNPQNGTFQSASFNNGKATSMPTIGGGNTFKSFFHLISSGSTVNLKVVVDFGTNDSSIVLAANDNLTVQISPTSSTLGDGTTITNTKDTPLSSNPISFSQAISGLTAGTTYKICVVGNYIIGDSGKSDSAVCKSVVATSATQTLTINAKGDPSVLQTEQCVAQNGGNATNCANGTDNSGNQAALDCGSKSLNWLVCPVVNLLQGAAEQLDNFITSELNVKTDNIFAGSNAKGYHDAWNSFRILATAIIVIAGLIMVASQALGFEFLDAYTIRKIMPRLLVAIIGISLSWPIIDFVIGFFDTVGYDIMQLIYTPFNSLAQNGGVGGLVTASWVLAPVAVGGALFVFGPAVLTFLLAGFLALVLAFLVLIIRQIAVIVLIILVPVAIASYVLPNTQKVWKIWSDNFFGLMLMFPIVTALIAAGHVFAAVTRTGGTVQQFIGIIAYFIPYFMLPFAFRLATGAIGTLAGMVNDRGKGVFDRLRNARGNAASKRWEATRSGHRFAGGTETNLRGRLNRGLGVATNVSQAGYNPKQWRSRMNAYTQGHAFDSAMEGLEKNADMRAIKDNDSLLWAGLAGQTDTDVRRWLATDHFDRFGKKVHSAQTGDELDQNVAAIRRARRSMGEQSFRAAATVAQSATGTGFEDSAQMLQTIATASGGDKALAGRMLGAMRGMANQSGRHDLGGAGFGTSYGQLANAIDGKAIDLQALQLDAFKSTDAVTLSRDRNESVRNVSQAVADRITDLSSRRATLDDDDRKELGRLTAGLENWRDSANMYGAPQRVETLAPSLYDSTPGREQVKYDVDNRSILPQTNVGSTLPEKQEPQIEGYNEQRSQRPYNPNDPNTPQPL